MEKLIKQFLTITNTEDGFDFGSGSGSGSGSSLNSGFGFGFSSGYGSGSGSGSGSSTGTGIYISHSCGYGDGYNYDTGSGNNFGSGSSFGSGYGCGDEDNDRIKSINGYKIYEIDSIQTIFHSIRGNIAKCSILKSDLTLEACYVAKVGDFFAHGETIKAAIKDATRKYELDLPIEERIDNFKKEFPNLDCKIPAKKLFDWHEKLTGSCELGRNMFCYERNIDLNTDSFTVDEFINLTINSYENHIIKQLKESYKL